MLLKKDFEVVIYLPKGREPGEAVAFQGTVPEFASVLGAKIALLRMNEGEQTENIFVILSGEGGLLRPNRLLTYDVSLSQVHQADLEWSHFWASLHEPNQPE
jgi:hypothetical protein